MRTSTIIIQKLVKSQDINYHINEKQWTYCNMTMVSIDDFISRCAGVGGGWKKIVNINIDAGDDCPGEWRKAT